MGNRYLSIIASFCFCFPAWTWAGTGPPRPSAGSTIKLFQGGAPIQNMGRFLAQNHSRETSVDSAGDDTEKTGKDTTRPDFPKKEKRTPKKTEQLKPFVPSEKIPADQGVDFPYDI